MIFAEILAGGIGKRMGDPDRPKQFMMLGDKPILIHTLEKFCAAADFDAIVVLCPEEWIQQTTDLVNRYLPAFDNIRVVAGGAQRYDTVMNGLRAIEAEFEVDEDAIVVTHDAVRPFVTHRMIVENIAAARQYGACDTVIPATDTIVHSVDGSVIADIPKRAEYYQGQTPQSFKMLSLKKLYRQLTDEQKSILTDACKIFAAQGELVALVQGDVSNIKITYPHDLRVARAMLADETGAIDA